MGKKLVCGIMLLLLTLSTIMLSSNIRSVYAWSGDVVINADGSISPGNAPVSHEGNLYKLTGDVYGSISVLRSNVVVDGAGHNIVTDKDFGVYVHSVVYERLVNVTFMNAKITSTSQSLYGIRLSSVDNVTIRYVTVTSTFQGIYCEQVGSVIIDENNLSGNYIGICIYEAAGYTVVGNNITDNEVGIMYGAIGGCKFYHNNFVNNTEDVQAGWGQENSWDNGYPSGGNYWDRYSGTDEYSGPNQDIPGSDGIGDQAYVIDASYGIIDYYPLMESYKGNQGTPPQPPQSHLLTMIPSVGGSTSPLYGTYNITANSVLIEAFPDVGWQFDHWILDGITTASNNPLRIAMDRDRTAEAVFYHPPHLDGTIYIRADGSVDPETAPIYRDANLYTVVANITSDASGIVIERDNIILDGGNFLLQGTGSSPKFRGIDLTGRSNVVITCFTIKDFAFGVYLNQSSNIEIIRNNIIGNRDYGISLIDSSKNNVYFNNISGTDYRGIAIWYENSSSNNVFENHVKGDGQESIYVYYASNNTISSNKIIGGTYGIRVANGKNNILDGNQITQPSIIGIFISSSEENLATRNVITDCAYGIESAGVNNTLSWNRIEGRLSMPHEGITVSGIYHTVENNDITNFDTGILCTADNSSIVRNRVRDTYLYGIRISNCRYGDVAGNEIEASSYGLVMEKASYFTLRANSIYGNKFNFWVSGEMLKHFTHDIDVSNVVDDKPIYYWVNQHNKTIPVNAGYVGLVDCTEITVKNLQLANNGQGVLLAGTTNSTITQNNIVHNLNGIHLAWMSNYTVITDNNITQNNECGIRISYSSNYNTVYRNSIAENGYGIQLDSSQYNNIRKNSITLSQQVAISLFDSSWNEVSGNTITNNNVNLADGIFLETSSNNSISRNKISNNLNGIFLSGSAYNIISENDVTQNNLNGIYIATYDKGQITKTIGSSYNLVAGNNIISNNRSGIAIENEVYHVSNHNRIIGNNIAGNEIDGIKLSAPVWITITGNVIKENNRDGIRIQDTRYQVYEYTLNNIAGNQIIANNQTGINIVAISDVNRKVETFITENYISGNGIGISLPQAFFGKICHNSIIQNCVAPSNGQDTVWDDGYPSGGNYWSDYSGVDSNSDGIGDTPYIIDANNTDRYPLINPWTPQKATITTGGQSYTATLTSNATISQIASNTSSLSFTVTGPTGQTGYVLVIFPALNTTELQITVDGAPFEAPYPIITSNGTHYFIYFELSFSTHNIVIQYASAQDNEPPTTILTMGEPKYVDSLNNIYVSSATTFALFAEDNIGGVGLASTFYRIYNSTYNTGWIKYSGSFTLIGFKDGEYSIDYYSTDNVGNKESAHTIKITLFSWNYIFEDTYGRGTTLKINLAHKFFQFITPDKDYGIREATYMRQCGRTIIIHHCDSELRLNTVAVDTRLDFCVAIAWDKQTHKQYFLIDKVGKE